MAMKRFLVQKLIEGEVHAELYTESELITYLDMVDCCEDKYKIYDISNFGEIKDVFFRGWQPLCLIEVIDANGNVVLRGCGTDH